MRKIKFRGYSEKSKKWLYCDYAYCENSMHIVDFFRKAKGNHLKNISQFTGVKDKNGKEIYEGDIIKKKIPHSCYDFERKESFFEVFYDNDSASFRLLKIENPRYKEFAINLGEKTASFCYEVVGNIFENQELLNE